MIVNRFKTSAALNLKRKVGLRPYLLIYLHGIFNRIDLPAVYTHYYIAVLKSHFLKKRSRLYIHEAEAVRFSVLKMRVDFHLRKELIDVAGSFLHHRPRKGSALL